MCSEEVMVMANRRNLVWGRKCEWVTLVFVFGGIGEGHPLLELLGVDEGYRIGYIIGM